MIRKNNAKVKSLLHDKVDVMREQSRNDITKT